MTTLNRKEGPPIVIDYPLEFPPFSKTTLANGVPVYEVNSGTQDIIKVDLVFKVGRVNEIKRASSKASMRLLREGTSNNSSAELAYKFDYYGAIVKIFSGLEYSYINIVCLTRHLESVWETFLEMVLQPKFDEKEIDKYKVVTSQNLRNQLSKNDVLSYRKITEIIFGSSHPYGYNTEISDIESLTRDHIQKFWQNNIGFNNAFLVLSGKYGHALRQKIIKSIESIELIASPKKGNFFETTLKKVTERIPTTNQKQTSLKIGRRMFGRMHEDYSKVQMLNTALGGYFGSRLMMNVREEKGYTYGIYSSIDSWKEDGFIYISADVANKNLEPTITEIYKEIEKLKTKLLPDEEFKMVKNYMLGQMLHLIDGPFATAQLIKNIHTKDIEIEHFKAHVSLLKSLEAKDILEMANKYLDINYFTTVLAGKIK